MKTIEQYLKDNPDSSLKEYNNYVKEEEEKESLKKKESKERRKKLLNSYVGKCFRLDFNDQSTIFFKLDKEIDLNHRCIDVDAYSVYIYRLTNRTFNIGFEQNRSLNINWFPGQEEWVDKDYYSSAYIISEESFNEIVKYYKVVNEIVGALKEIK